LSVFTATALDFGERGSFGRNNDEEDSLPPVVAIIVLSIPPHAALTY